MDEREFRTDGRALYCVSKKTKRVCHSPSFLATVGDEMFGGYDRYRMAYAASLYQDSADCL